MSATNVALSGFGDCQPYGSLANRPHAKICILFHRALPPFISTILYSRLLRLPEVASAGGQLFNSISLFIFALPVVYCYATLLVLV